MSTEEIFKRNWDWASAIKYDLHQVHSPAVVEMLQNTADQFLIDEQLLFIGLRTLVAHHEDLGHVVVANSPQRARKIVEFTLLMSNVGEDCSTITYEHFNMFHSRCRKINADK